jgi:drug/metabolite transporter (DMT)-like permease
LIRVLRVLRVLKVRKRSCRSHPEDPEDPSERQPSAARLVYVTSRPPAVSRARIALAFAAVYVVWGSTYLAIRYAIETIPPFLMAASRFLIAGAALYAWGRLTGAERPSRAALIATSVTGILMLAVGNGAVTWSEQRIPSGIAALLVASVALWMVLLEFLRRNGTRPTRLSILGLLIGFGGVGLLVGPAAFTSARDLDVLASLVLIGASIRRRCRIVAVARVGRLSHRLWIAGGVYRICVAPARLHASGGCDLRVRQSDRGHAARLAHRR